MELTKKQIAADVAFIKKYLKTNKVVPEEGQDVEIPAKDDDTIPVRTYVYTDSEWVFKSFKGAESDSASDSEEESDKSDPEPEQEQEPSDEVVKKNASKKSKKQTESESDEMSSESTEATTVATKKSRQPKKVKELLMIMAALDKNKIEKAKELLAAAIESAQGSAKEKKERKPSEYNMFMSSELTKLKDTHPDTPPKDRMKIAMENWKTAKAVKMAAI